MASGLASPGADRQQVGGVGGGWRVDGRGCLLMPNKQEMAPYVYHQAFSPVQLWQRAGWTPFVNASHASSWCLVCLICNHRTFSAFRFRNRPRSSLCSWNSCSALSVRLSNRVQANPLTDKLDPRDLGHMLDSYNTSHWWTTVCFSCTFPTRCTDAALFFK